MRRTLSLLLGLQEVLRKRLSLLVVMAAIGAGVLLVGAAGSKVQASQPEHSRGDSSTYFAHQQGHKGKGHNDGLDPALQNKLEAAFEKSFRESGAPGAIVAVRTPEGTWVSTRGVADLSSGEPMKPEMYHRIGSVTKTFTATLLLQAEAEGRLSLDDTIEKYIKGVPNGDEITLRQMADMTSGLADYTSNEQFLDEMTSSNPERVWTPQEVARIGIEDSPVFDPGTAWLYSNTNYALLGLVLEQVTGKSLERLYSKQIFKPLHMKDTSLPDAEDSSIPDPHSQGYILLSKDAEPVNTTEWNPSWAWAAGGIISTVEDMLLYGRAMGTGKGLLPPQQQTERLDSFVRDLPPFNQPPINGEFGYGLGLTYDRGWIGHVGDIPGYNTVLIYHPDLDATVLVEVNSDISAGNCPEDIPTLKDGPKEGPCSQPAPRIYKALAEALGKPATPIPDVEPDLETP
jgi:D-alanyl-D-alanine carboxypeptidase